MYNDLLELIVKTLKFNNYTIQEIETVQAVRRRKNGESFNFEDHIAGMVYSLLSNQRPWKAIANNYETIREIFHNFNPDYLQTIEPIILVNQLREIKCGNRSINSLMNSLNYNIEQFKKIIKLYGSMDNYVTSNEPLIIARSFAEGEYKLKQMGIALTIEYLKNVGIDAFKPDIHMRRLFGKDRLGLSDKSLATEKEILEIIKHFSSEIDTPISEIDSIIWQFCASNYAEICGSNPKCENCLVRKKCNYKSVRY